MADSTFKTLDPWNRGDPLLAKRLDDMVKAINALAQRVTKTETTGRSAVAVARFTVETEYGDYLKCREYSDDEDVGGDENGIVLVAKPYLLRRGLFDPARGGSPRAGITYTFADADPDADPPMPIIRTATDEDDNTEDQVIVPSYEEGDMIFAICGIERGTFLATEKDSASAGTGKPIIWLDLNIDGRYWMIKDE